MTSSAPRRGRILLALPLAATLTAALPLAAQQSGAPSAPSATAPSGAAGTAAKKPAAAAPAEKPVDKNAVSYSLGVMFGEQLKGGGLQSDSVSTERLGQGVRDALSGKAKLSDDDRAHIMQMVRASQQALVDTNHKAAAKFLAENGKKPGVITTASGLEYQVHKEGTGASPKASDEAVVNYRGTLLDGTEFDSSYKRGQPATFPVGRVIPGWTEGLQLMKPGGKYTLWVPPQLAYDMRSPSPTIPPGSLLVFEVELLSAKPAAPAAAPGAGHPGMPVPKPQPAAPQSNPPQGH
jgi:FKBP-type peptidyl-prolyl cis-trans isomerase FkpA